MSAHCQAYIADLSSTEITPSKEGALQSLLYEKFLKIHSSTRMCYASNKHIEITKIHLLKIRYSP